MSRADIIAGEGYWRDRLAVGDISIAVTDALREIAQAKEAEAEHKWLHDWLGELAASDHTPELKRVDRAAAELDRAWKEIR